MKDQAAGISCDQFFENRSSCLLCQRSILLLVFFSCFPAPGFSNSIWLRVVISLPKCCNAFRLLAVVALSFNFTVNLIKTLKTKLQILLPFRKCAHRNVQSKIRSTSSPYPFPSRPEGNERTQDRSCRINIIGCSIK